jgi:hypothetical protein
LHQFDSVLKGLQSILPKGPTGDKKDVWGKVGAAAVWGAGVGGAIGLADSGGLTSIPSAALGAVVFGGLKAGQIALGLDSDDSGAKVKQFGGSVSQTGEAAATATGYLSNFIKALGAMGSEGFHPMNYVPSAPGHAVEHHADIRMDGDKVGKVIMRRIASRSLRPLEGSAYHDNTWNSPAQDTSLSMG